MAHGRCLLVALLVSGSLGAQPLATDYHSLTSVGLMGGMIRVADGTDPALGASLGVDRRIRPAAAIRFQVDVIMDVSSTDLISCPTPAFCGNEKVAFSLLPVIGPEFGARREGSVTPFGGAQVGVHVSNLSRPVGSNVIAPVRDALTQVGAAAGLYLGVRTGQPRKHFRGTLSYTLLGGRTPISLIGVRLGVEW